MAINKQDIYSNYVSKIQTALEENNFEGLDYILEFITTSLNEEQLEYISDLIDEVTLFVELKEDEYKDEALGIIEEDFLDAR